MGSEPAAIVRLARLQQSLAVDCEALEARAAEVEELVGHWQRDGNLPRPELVLLAVNLHGWYTALETAFERVARLVDQSVPAGSAWHLELLEQMQLELPGVRPAALAPAAAAKLHELRKFRHFFRNAYALDLQPPLVRLRAEELLEVREPVSRQLTLLLRHVDAALAELSGSAKGAG
jgi:hypothetical protein